MAGRMTFGYLYDFRNPPQWRQPWTDLYARTLEVIAWTESVGFTGAWVPEHHLAEDGYQPAPFSVLAAIAARTRTLRLGSAIALAPLYHPVRFAEECAVLDILSGGRLDMGVGIGYRRREYEAFGLDFTRRGARFDEFLQIVQALWAGETVNFEGRHFTVKNAKIEPRPPRGRIPLYIGGFAERALERVARYGDGYIGNEDAGGLYLEKWQQQGRDPALARIRITGLFVTVARDPEKAMAELAPCYLHVSNCYAAWMNENRALGIDDPAFKPMDLGQFKKSGILQILTPEQAVARFSAMQARMPVEHFMMMMPPGLAPERFVEYAQCFADEVMPALR